MLRSCRCEKKLVSIIGVNDGDAMTIPGNEANVPLSRATWTAADALTTDGELFQRTMHGELRLPTSLVPNFKFGSRFDLKYVVDVYPFKVAGFVPAKDDRLLRTDVAITSDHGGSPGASGERPPFYASLNQ